MESKMKCCRIPAEKGCSIFSIINAVIVGACLAACICYAGWVINFHVHRTNENELDLALDIILCIILSVCTSVSFMFAVVLCYGAHKKRPAFLMTYFVFGILVEIVSVVGAIFYLVSTYDSDDPNVEEAVLGSVALIGCVNHLMMMKSEVVYAFPLALVYRAFAILSSDTVLPSGHTKLPNLYPVL